MEVLAEIFEVEQADYHSIEVNSRSYKYFILKEDAKEIPIIEFYHPQATRAAAFGKMRGHLLWKAMFDDIKEIGKRKTDGR